MRKRIASMWVFMGTEVAFCVTECGMDRHYTPKRKSYKRLVQFFRNCKQEDKDHWEFETWVTELGFRVREKVT